MKNRLKLIILSCLLISFASVAKSQTAKAPVSCKIFLDDKVITDYTLENVIKWCDLEPPTVQCDDNKVYKLESFKISFLTLKPFQNQDFGIGEGGFPIRARMAIKDAKSGDTIILKEATYTDAAGTKNSLPVISIKIK